MYVVILTSRITSGTRAAIVSSMGEDGDWLELSDSTFAIKTQLSSRELAARLRDIGVDSPICIMPIRDTTAATLPEKVRWWLNQENWVPHYIDNPKSGHHTH
jgi:hypothetical protein